MEDSARSFRLPNGMSLEQQIAFCLKIIRKQRQEVLPLRRSLSQCNQWHDPLLQQLKEWKDKYQKAREENKKLQRENNKLKKEIEKLTKTNNRYQVSLFDHGNFTHPDKKDTKRKGGQKGHANTNKDGERSYASFQRIRLHAGACGKCGKQLVRTGSSKEKILIDIEINPKLIELILQSERQWCSNCKKEVRATHPQSLPFTEYGINTFMVVMHLRFKGKQSVRTIAVTLHSLFGLPITKSGVLSLLTKAKEYLEGKYEELKLAIRKDAVMYNDETGWAVRGKPAWMWIMTTPDKKQENGSVETGMTVYVAAESRGKGVFEEMYGNSKAYSMHDGYSSYESVTGKEKTTYCWAHVLRFCFEETIHLLKNHPAVRIRDRLVTLYQTIRFHTEWTKEQKEKTLEEEIESLLKIPSDDQTVKNIRYRLHTQKEGLILALLMTPDGTNNLAEREFRELVQSRNISFGSDTYTGMEGTAILASVVKTIQRDKNKLFLPTLKLYLQDGIKQKHFQYKHTPVFDT